MVFEYFDRKAPWNEQVTLNDPFEREALVRKHVEGHFEKTPTGRFVSKHRHGLESLLMEIVPCRSHKTMTTSEAFNAAWVERLSEKLCSDFRWHERQLYRMKSLTAGQKEKIIQTLIAHDDLPLYRFTQEERIEQAGIGK